MRVNSMSVSVFSYHADTSKIRVFDPTRVYPKCTVHATGAVSPHGLVFSYVYVYVCINVRCAVGASMCACVSVCMCCWIYDNIMSVHVLYSHTCIHKYIQHAKGQVLVPRRSKIRWRWALVCQPGLGLSPPQKRNHVTMHA